MDAQLPGTAPPSRGDAIVSPPSPKIKRESDETFELPYRPFTGGSVGRRSGESGEAISSTPFPRALYGGMASSDLSTRTVPNRHSATSASRLSIQHGPTPEEGTPQDRFRQVVLGSGPGVRTEARPGGSASGQHMSFADHARRLVTAAVASNENASRTRRHTSTSSTRRDRGRRERRPDHSQDSNPAPSQSPIELLSRECQARHFNPRWLMEPRAGNRVGCTVILRDKIISADGSFPDFQEAKNAAACKALPVVRAMPNRPNPSQATSYGFPERAASAIGHSMPAIEQDGDTVMTGIGESRALMPAPAAQGMTTQAMTTQATATERTEEPADLLDHVRRVMGISLPDPGRDSPEVTRAFLEGLAAGARLTQAPAAAAAAARAGRHTRSCSPPPASWASWDNRRERSPPLDRDPQERWIAERPRPDRYRPSTDRYRPEYYTFPGFPDGNWVHDRYRH